MAETSARTIPLELSAGRPPLRTLVLLASGSVAVLTGCFLGLWLSQREWVIEIVSSRMKANTALCLLCASGALLLQRRAPAAAGRVRLARALAAVCALLGFLTLCQYLFGWDLHLDQLLARGDSSQQSRIFPGRMAPNAAVGLFFLGTALAVLDLRPLGRFRLAPALLFGASVVGVITLVGYLYRTATLYRVTTYVRISPYTAVCLLVLALSALCARPHRPPIAVLLGRGSAGFLARRMLLGAVLVPLALGWLRLEGERAGLYDTTAGTAFFVVAQMVFFGVFIWTTVRALGTLEDKREEAEREVRRSLASRSRLFEAGLLGVMATDARGVVREANDTLLRMLGYTRDEVLAGKLNLGALTPPAREEGKDLGPARTAEAQGPVETEYLRKDGSRVPVLTGAAIVDEEAQRALSFVLDLSSRKRAEEERAQLAAVVERSSDFIAIGDLDGTVRYLNEAGRRLVGLGDLAPLRTRVEEYFAPEDATFVQETLLSAIVSGGRWAGETRLRNFKTGALVPVLCEAFAIRDDSGKPRSIATVTRDLSAQKREEQGLRLLADASAALAGTNSYAETLTTITRLVVPTLADWCIVDALDEEGNARRVAVAHRDPSKSALAERLRQSPPRPSGRNPASEGLTAEGPVLIPELTDARVSAFSSGPEQLRLMQEVGMRSVLVVPLIARERRLGVLSLVFTDESGRHFSDAEIPLAEEIGRRAALAVDNARLYGKAEEANRAKDEFLAMLGHELRNPLSPILTALQLMRLRGEPSALRERAVIERQVNHLVGLVDDLLDVSRITRGKIELRRRAVDIAEVIAAGIEIASPLLEGKNHSLSLAVARGVLIVDGDPARLAQVVSNLVGNAAKYTDPGGHIRVEARRDGGEIVVSVQDDGMGIPQDLLPRVFDLFEQGPRALDRAQGGLGLGLAIVRSIAAIHGGSVAATSDGPGLGSRFSVRLPATDEQPASTQPPPPLNPRAVRGEAAAIRVLVVDDNEDAALLLREALQAQGFEAHAAHDGPHALELARELPPELAILDLGLPVMDGYELARRLRALPGGARMGLFALTGYGQETDRQRSAAAGFNEHLVKPLDLALLAATVKRWRDRRGQSGAPV